jgi:hypothetical protein
MNYRLFDKRWFAKHQNILLFLLNTPLLSIWFRHTIGISYKGKIDAIHPNAFFVIKGNDTKAFFLSHDGYSKQLVRKFKYLWLALHSWDMATKIPALNLGYDSLTANPRADTTAPTDGKIMLETSNSTWAALRDATDGSGVNIDAHDYESQVGVTSGTSTDRWNNIYRAYYGFDTSAMGAGAIASEILFSICAGDGKGNTFSAGSNIDLVGYAGADPGTTADFDQFGTTVFDTKAYADYSEATSTTRNQWTCNASGLANIVPTGITYYALRMAWDTSNTPPTWESNKACRIYPMSADHAGTDYDPLLTVTYTLPTGPNTKRLLMGLGI